ncbi:unnamed protein product, partial [Tilletia caries]
GGLDVVVTVPALYSAPERQAIYDTAGLVGVRPRLVSDGAVVLCSPSTVQASTPSSR